MADQNLFIVTLVTPERVLISGVASQVMLRTADGDITFLGGHTPLVGAVEPGVVRVVDSDGGVQRIAVHGGFVQVEQHVDHDADGDADSTAVSASVSAVGGTRVTVLAGVAELADDIDTDRARLALDAAEARVVELTAAGGRGGSGPATGEDDEIDTELVDAESAVFRAKVRLEAAEAPVSA
jgi:F-type H+-transporting ATPase subunit epsilon